MSAFRQSKPSWICPRCKEDLPPGEARCYRCGFQTARVQPNSTTPPAQSFLSSRTGKGRPRRKHRAAFIYFLSVFLVIVVFAFLLLKGAGISLSTLFSEATTTPSTVTYSVPKVSPLFSDSFLSDAYGWNLQSAPGKYAVRVGDGAMTLEIDKHNLLWELVPGERSYSNFLLTVNAVLSQGDQNNGYGVYIRGDKRRGRERDHDQTRGLHVECCHSQTRPAQSHHDHGQGRGTVLDRQWSAAQGPLRSELCQWVCVLVRLQSSTGTARRSGTVLSVRHLPSPRLAKCDLAPLLWSERTMYLPYLVGVKKTHPNVFMSVRIDKLSDE